MRIYIRNMITILIAGSFFLFWALDKKPPQNLKPYPADKLYELKSNSIFGDTQDYYLSGMAFAEKIQKGNGVFKTIIIENKNALRPYLFRLYSTLPFLLAGKSGDYILAYHYIILLNLFTAFLASVILLGFFNYKPITLSIKKILMIGVLALSFTASIPIMMSDSLAFCYFLIGVAILKPVSERWESGILLTKSDFILLFFSGLFFSLSALTNQKAIMYSFFFILSFAILNRKVLINKQQLKQNITAIICLVIGLSFILTQVIYIYYHFNVLGLYTQLNVPLTQSDLELVAYSLPIEGAYQSQLQVKSLIAPFVRLYLGMGKIYLPIYHGNIPTDIYYNNLSFFFNLKSLSFFLIFSACTFYLLKEYKGYAKILLISACCTAIFTALYIHTENRYYIFPRTVYALFLIDLICAKLRELRQYFWSFANRLYVRLIVI